MPGAQAAWTSLPDGMSAHFHENEDPSVPDDLQQQYEKDGWTVCADAGHMAAHLIGAERSAEAPSLRIFPAFEDTPAHFDVVSVLNDDDGSSESAIRSLTVESARRLLT
jgi:hypothetical protein